MDKQAENIVRDYLLKQRENTVKSNSITAQRAAAFEQAAQEADNPDAQALLLGVASRSGRTAQRAANKVKIVEQVLTSFTE
jgi:hypothetical protein